MSSLHKRAQSRSFLGGLILLGLGVILLINVILNFSAKAESATQEQLCMTFNAIKFGYEQKAGLVSKMISPPRACNTLDKGVIPTKEFRNRVDIPTLKEKATAETRRMMSRCWWMWLEGRQKNMFDKAIYKNDGCFVCYTFSVERGASFSSQDLVTSLYETYEAVDSSDKCASGGGGKCLSSCPDTLPSKAQSTTCPKGQQCCVSKNRENECVEKGGSCIAVTGSIPYAKWRCPTGTCYVPTSQSATYLDYIQGTRGSGDGPGMVIMEEGVEFSPGNLYAVTLVSPSDSWGLRSITGQEIEQGAAVGATAAGTIGAGVATAYLISWLFPPAGVVFTGVLALGAAGAAGGAIVSASPKDINYVLVSKYDTISKKCAIEDEASS